MIFDLPTTVEFGGRQWDINTDYRDILTVLIALGDDELSNEEKAYVCLYNLYPDFESIPQELLQDAFNAALDFVDRGNKETSHGPRTMDWEQDAAILFPAINRSAGCEVRSLDYLHWWTFIGYFMEIKDTTYSTILSLRQKKARGKKLEKWEKEYWSSNKDLCVLKPKETDDDRAEKERLKKLLGG